MRARDVLTQGRAMLRAEEQGRPTPAPKGTAPFYKWLMPLPTLPDLEMAKLYLASVRNVLEADAKRSAADVDKLTRGQRSTLQRIERKWAKRAAGKDARWNLNGTKAGRITKESEATIRRPDPDWT